MGDAKRDAYTALLAGRRDLPATSAMALHPACSPAVARAARVGIRAGRQNTTHAAATAAGPDISPFARINMPHHHAAARRNMAVRSRDAGGICNGSPAFANATDPDAAGTTTRSSGSHANGHHRSPQRR